MGKATMATATITEERRAREERKDMITMTIVNALMITTEERKEASEERKEVPGEAKREMANMIMILLAMRTLLVMMTLHTAIPTHTMSQNTTTEERREERWRKG